ncbi:ABC-F family ATP-binding cassette domain-containing protein [Marinagarivorans cellulosilyticus]|uniref:Probable ATP-binding protein YheS n=1 Tax=Marinagarivorans cellulosilyticus TaxID=2721545 RepID=A0AAN1WKR7_9GAMM|nr:ATP-binding cassette domain-containing protein [Marinagarivorans cellulosilyticus]BCD99471.1 ATP-binding cassette, subfamily F, member 3 [Marinagarivorans cellulosilyticus]
MIKLTQASLQRGHKILLEKASLTVHIGEKLGVIGANGSGKSSLFKLLIGELAVDAGDLHVPSAWKTAHMAQEVGAGERTALDYVQDGDTELRAIEQAIAKVGDDGEKLANLYAQYEHIDGYTAAARAMQLIAGLGFCAADGARPVSDFSGGWRIRLNLAQALMCRSDLLLLDEPTNHLDLDATLWLEQRLKQYQGTLLIISHDRDFLDNVVTGIANFENTQLISYSGNYSAYERQKAERLAQQQAAFEKQQERITEIESFVRRFRAKATKAKQAQSRLKELERMEQLSPAHIDSPFNFRFPTPERIPQQLITLSDADLGYGNKVLLKKVQLSIHGNSRLGLLGANGAGKSTLMKTLVGEGGAKSTLLAGDRVEGAHLRIGYFNQHQLEALDMNASCALHLQRLSPKASEQEVRNFLGSFDFQGDRAFETIQHFSGGEKARLAMAIVAWQKPNLLLLDEPTNHLDLEVRHALTLALQGFDGAVVLVSHDRHLLRNSVEEFLLVDDGKVSLFDGDLHDYETWLTTKSASATGGQSPTETTAVQDKNTKKTERQNNAAMRAQLKPLTNAVKKLEKEIDKLQQSLTAVEQELSDPDIYTTGGETLTKTLKRQAEISEKLEMCEEEWMLKSEELETLTQG